MNHIKSEIFLANAAIVLALAPCDAAKDTSQPVKSATVATANGKAITQRTVDMVAAQGADSGRPDTPESRKSIIDQIALQMLVAEEAVKKGLHKTPEVTEQIEAIRQSVLANAYVQDFIKTTVVTDDMVKAEYDRVKATVSGTEYKARHILVDKETDAKDIIGRLKSEPAAFEKLAMQKSKDTASKVQGGDLGWFDVRGHGARVRRCPEQTAKRQDHRRAGQDPVWLSRHPAGRLPASRSARHGIGKGPDHATTAATKPEKTVG